MLPSQDCCQPTGCLHNSAIALASRLGLLMGRHSCSSALISRCQLSGHSAHKLQMAQRLPRLTGCDPLLRPNLQGKKKNTVAALEIICDAVDRYKELCEGTHCGEHWV